MTSSAPTAKALYARLLRHVWPYRAAFGAAIAAMVVSALTDSSFAALMKWMVDGTFVHKDPSLMKLLPVAIIGITLVRGLSGRVSGYRERV